MPHWKQSDCPLLWAIVYFFDVVATPFSATDSCAISFPPALKPVWGHAPLYIAPTITSCKSEMNHEHHKVEQISRSAFENWFRLGWGAWVWVGVRTKGQFLRKISHKRIIQNQRDTKRIQKAQSFQAPWKSEWFLQVVLLELSVDRGQVEKQELWSDPFPACSDHSQDLGMLGASKVQRPRVKGSSAHANSDHMYTQSPFEALKITCARSWGSHVHTSEPTITCTHKWDHLRTNERTNEGTNERMNESDNQPINQSTNQSMNQSINQLINESRNPWTNEGTNEGTK